jgi:hypothetical protein
MGNFEMYTVHAMLVGPLIYGMACSSTSGERSNACNPVFTQIEDDPGCKITYLFTISMVQEYTRVG